MAVNYTYLVVDADSVDQLKQSLAQQDPQLWREPKIFETTYTSQEEAQAIIHRILGRSYPVIAARFVVPPPSKRLEAATQSLRHLLDQLQRAQTPAATGRIQKKVAVERARIAGIKRDLAPRSTRRCWIVGAITEA
jgi:hypothetical protein